MKKSRVRENNPKKHQVCKVAQSIGRCKIIKPRSAIQRVYFGSPTVYPYLRPMTRYLCAGVGRVFHPTEKHICLRTQHRTGDALPDAAPLDAPLPTCISIHHFLHPALPFYTLPSARAPRNTVSLYCPSSDCNPYASDCNLLPSQAKHRLTCQSHKQVHTHVGHYEGPGPRVPEKKLHSLFSQFPSTRSLHFTA